MASSVVGGVTDAPTSSGSPESGQQLHYSLWAQVTVTSQEGRANNGPHREQHLSMWVLGDQYGRGDQSSLHVEPSPSLRLLIGLGRCWIPLQASLAP